MVARAVSQFGFRWRPHLRLAFGDPPVICRLVSLRGGLFLATPGILTTQPTPMNLHPLPMGVVCDAASSTL